MIVLPLRSFQLPRNSLGGFSVVELMVSIGIIVLITGIAMVRYSSFNSTILLTNQAYELALDIRQAQVLGVSVQAGATPGDDVNRSPIGISVGVGRQEYVLFRDSVITNNQYDSHTDPSLDEQIGDAYRLDDRFEIVSICADGQTGTSCNVNREATISFQRPDFNADFWIDGTSSIGSELVITLAPVSGNGSTKSIVVEGTGLISVQ